MFLKKILLSMVDINNSTESNISFVDIMMKVDAKNLKSLVDAGYNVRMVESSLSYKYPAKYPGDTLLYLYILLQDVLRGRVFNNTRMYAYCMIKDKVYKKPLTEKELSSYNVDDNYHTTVSGSVSKKTEGRKIIAFSATNPGVGKSTTTDLLLDSLEADGYSVDVFTIADIIKTTLKFISKIINKDEGRFYENYSEKDVLKTFGSETVPFKTRDLLCDFSLLVQKYYGKNIWGNLAIESLSSTEDLDVIVIDDLRRKDELDVLKEYFKDDLFVISLSKEDLTSTEVIDNLSEAAKSFEGGLESSDFDYEFTFKKDWSNTEDLISYIKENVL